MTDDIDRPLMIISILSIIFYWLYFFLPIFSRYHRRFIRDGAIFQTIHIKLPSPPINLFFFLIRYSIFLLTFWIFFIIE